MRAVKPSSVGATDLAVFCAAYEKLLPPEEKSPTPSTTTGFSIEELERFFSDLDFRLAIRDSTKRQLDRQIASDFSVFEFIEPDENKLSDILGLLLDPNGAHGQQELFLRLFLQRLGITPVAPLKKASIAREALTHGISRCLRRMDVLVTIGNFNLALENKVESPEQEDQLRDYHNHLKAIGSSDYALVFLTPEGRLPESLAKGDIEFLKADRRLFCLAYHKDLLPWLIACRQNCESDKVRHFLADFITFIRTDIREEVHERESANEPS